MESTMGALVRPGDPNYLLVSTAAKTIQRIIHQSRLDEPHGIVGVDLDSPELPHNSQPRDALAPLEPWSFELEFWDNLAERSSLLDL